MNQKNCETPPSKKTSGSFLQYITSFFRHTSDSSSNSLNETNSAHTPNQQNQTSQSKKGSSGFGMNWKSHSTSNIKKFPGAVKPIKNSDSQSQQQNM